jgi:23S rRNA pseudouridine1911/1915/1917 synthase
VLPARFGFVTRARASEWIRGGRLRVDGRVVTRPASSARAGQKVELTIEKLPRDSHAAIDDLLALPVLARGEGWLAVDKPPGVVAHPAGNDVKRTLLTALALTHARDAEPGGPWLPHRLDKETSGLQLLALSLDTQRRISDAFRARAVRRFYDARVRGDASAHFPDSAALELRGKLARVGHRPPRVAVREEGAESLTRARLIEAGSDSSLLWLEPVTGLQHQLRAHLVHLGHPVLNDPLYDPEASAGERMCLHARALSVPAGVLADGAVQLETAPPAFARSSR